MGNTIIDISKNDTIISWSKLKKDCPFIIFRGTRGTDDVSPTMKTYINACENHKIPYFIYGYFNLGNEPKQAKYLIDQTRELVGKYFVGYALDMEESNPSSAILKAIKTVKKYAPTAKLMLYTMYSQYKIVKEAVLNRGDDVVWWEARYGKDTGEYDPKYKCHSGVDLHQYTTKGRLKYMETTADMNRLTGTVPLSWFTTPFGKTVESGKDVMDDSAYYPGEADIIFPKRGYFKLGDGYETYVASGPEIKKVQKLVNWVLKEIDGVELLVDGKYGRKTRASVSQLQILLGVKSDGFFGPVTLAAAMSYKR